MTARGVEFETVNYIEEPLSASSLKQLLRKAGLKPGDVVRTKEAAYKELIAGKDLTDEQMLELMAKHPELLQRPIVVRGNKAVLARPVNKVDELDF